MNKPGNSSSSGAESQIIDTSVQPATTLGNHALIDLSGCSRVLLQDHQYVRSVLLKAATVAETTVVQQVDHYFKPEGYTAVLLLEESHLSIHTWPEHDYASVDLFSCNLQTNFKAVINFLASALKATEVAFTLIKRGYAPAASPSRQSYLGKD